MPMLKNSVAPVNKLAYHGKRNKGLFFVETQSQQVSEALALHG